MKKQSTGFSHQTLKQLTDSSLLLNRRRFVTGAASSVILGAAVSPHSVFGRSIFGSTKKPLSPATKVLRGKQFDLNIGYQAVNLTGKNSIATVVNGTLPGPILRWKEGETVTINVTNNLAVDSSIHWHGMILPTNMDGVPGLSFSGIKPGETFKYEFKVKQSGTYWYHSHSGFQEQTGVYGAIVIDPKDTDLVDFDKDYVVLLSDWSDQDPKKTYRKLKKMSHYYNYRERTASDSWQDIKENGVVNTWKQRAMWNQMRMSDTDIADVTGQTYTYLMNGITPNKGWKALFKKGDKVRLRFINGSAMSIFDIRIPGLKMKVVASDGQNIEPVSIDEFRIGTAETYDVVVQPESDSAYCVFAQSIDRTGYTRGTLSADASLEADVPIMDHEPTLTHADMGMNMQGVDHLNHGNMAVMSAVTSATMHHSQMDHSTMNHGAMDESSTITMNNNVGTDDQSKMHHGGRMLGRAGSGSSGLIDHKKTEFGPHVDMRTAQIQSGINDPGIGLREHAQRYGRQVLTYAQIRNLTPTLDTRQPNREIQLHLTGNMKRYMWSLNGIKFADAQPLQLTLGERLRIVLVNDTMMTHPIHLHGVWSELETGEPNYIPRKHTVLVQPGKSISYLVTADAQGKWAYHCHLLYHMPGMMREVWIS